MTEPAAPAPAPAAPSLIERHPNALVSLGSGSGVGTLVVWALSHWTKLNPELATAIGGAVGAFALFVGRNGLAGIKARVLHGSAAG